MTSASSPRLTPRREATRARILAAATEAFAERGFYGTSVEEICERAGFTRGAFYSNFSSREELAVAIAAQRSEQIRERIRELTASGPLQSPTAVLHGVLDLYRDDAGARDRWAVLHTELTLHAVRDPEAGRAWTAHLKRSQHDIAEVLRDYEQRSGARLPIAVADLARLLYVTFIGGATMRLVAGTDGAPLEESLVRLVEHAVEHR